jgi:hypothetical protein
MCQTWSKQVENEDLRALYKGIPLFQPESFLL